MLCTVDTTVNEWMRDRYSIHDYRTYSWGEDLTQFKGFGEDVPEKDSFTWFLRKDEAVVR